MPVSSKTDCIEFFISSNPEAFKIANVESLYIYISFYKTLKNFIKEKTYFHHLKEQLLWFAKPLCFLQFLYLLKTINYFNKTYYCKFLYQNPKIPLVSSLVPPE